MVVLKVSDNPREQRAALLAALIVLKKGGVIAFPTETTYGLGCDPTNPEAVRKIYEMKGRDHAKPLQLIAGSMNQVRAIAEMNAKAHRVTKLFWPGPLTLLLPVKRGTKFHERVVEDDMIGIRVTSHELLQKLLRLYGRPIAATSANRSGEAPARSGRGIRRTFLTSPIKPNLLLDSGALPKRKPTTVAAIDRSGFVRILRKGGIRFPGMFRT
jgi:L-threonylcarbamoyladenylate synthase